MIDINALIILFISLPFCLDPPNVTDYNQTIRVTLGAPKNLSCPVGGNPEPYITWYKGNATSGAVLSSEKELSFPKPMLSDSGWYTCSANNSLGKPVSVSLQLLVGE